MEKHGLGRGTIGEVFVYSLNGENTQLFALKIIELNGSGIENKEIFIKHLINESKIFINLNHENVVKNYLYKIFKENCLVIFMEFCNLGNLDNYLSKKKQENIFLGEEEIKLIFLDILKGLQYLRLVRENKFIHEELKLDNIFLHQTKNGNLIAKVRDFFLKTFPKDC